MLELKSNPDCLAIVEPLKWQLAQLGAKISSLITLHVDFSEIFFSSQANRKMENGIINSNKWIFFNDFMLLKLEKK